ncbi:MAG: hypothetical protein RRY04_03110 [Oscillospiraceae bacterium]
MEFLFLASYDHSYIEEYADILKYFDVYNNNSDSIISAINQIYHATGENGLMEKYTYIRVAEDKVPKKPREIPFYKKPFLIVYEAEEKQFSEYLISAIQRDLLRFSLSCEVTSCKMEHYVSGEDRVNRDKRVVFLGKTKISTPSIRNINCSYDKFGIKYGTSGMTSAITVCDLKNKELDGFIKIAKEYKQRIGFKAEIPRYVAKSEMSFLKNIYGDTNIHDSTGVITTGLTTLITSPLIILGTATDGVVATIQRAQNSAAKTNLHELQYIIAIEKFLESETAEIKKQS